MLFLLFIVLLNVCVPLAASAHDDDYESSSMLLGISIRDAQEADAPQCSKLIKLLGYDMPTAYMLHYFPTFGKDKIDRVFVAVDDASQEVVGVMQVHLREFARRATIESLVVDEKHQGQGIGKLLVNAAEEHALARKMTIMELSSSNKREGAHKFYEALGYATDATHFAKALTELKKFASE